MRDVRNTSTAAALVPAGATSRSIRRGIGALVVLVLVLLGLPLVAGTAQAVSPRIELRVLVVSDDTPWTEAVASQLDREGVPYTRVRIGDAGRPRIDEAFLSDAAGATARFQAVVLPNQVGGSRTADEGGLSAEELGALTAYERAYGIRRISAYVYPSPSVGLDMTGRYAGPLDGAAVTVTEQGRSGAFGYLTGSLRMDDFDPAVTETYGYLPQVASPLAEGESFTPLLTAQGGSESGIVAGVHARDGREELVLTASSNSSMQWFNQLAPGLVSWATRGIHLGHQRNHLTVQIDDVLLTDDRWSVSGNCTPGPFCADPTVTTEEIRMTPADVTRLVEWQRVHDFTLDMAFNGGGSDTWAATNGGRDPLLEAFLPVQSQLRWVNHTYAHPFLGCIQIAPTAAGESWTCATTADQTPRMDTRIPGALQEGTYWAAQDYVQDQVQRNITWAQERGLTDFDPTELVTGEHSGLAVQPQQPADNPFLAPALAAAGVRYTASDASREKRSRAVGPSTVTVPRHPMNIFYNAATYQEEVDEYNWIYTSAADGGGGICEANPATSTCIEPLPAETPAAAEASFHGYVEPVEVRNTLGKVLTNDPRPFYAHQSNLAEDGILYPVLESVLAQYRSMYAQSMPLVSLDLRSQSEALHRMDAWRAASDSTTAYIDATGVHVVGGSTQVPLTVPAGTRVTGAGLEAYGGELSGWTSGAVSAVPPARLGGYGGAGAVTAPGAPEIASATPGDGSATVGWTAPDDGGSPITHYVVSVFTGADAPAVRTETVAAPATSLTVTGLTNGTAYSFTVEAVNAAGTGPASARSGSVTPAGVPDAPAITAVTAGNASASVTWTPPATDGGSPVTGYVVSASAGTGAPVTTTAPAGATGATVTGLVNGTTYTLTVAAVNAVGTGAASAPSAPVVPITVPGAPTIGQAKPGDGSATVTWAAPAATGGSPISSYVITTYGATGSQPVGQPLVVQDPSATNATVTGLTNGTTYKFTVTAVNAAGAGPASAKSNNVTPASLPGAPTNVSAKAGRSSATVSWTAPASTGGSPITGYVVNAYTGTGTTPVRSATASKNATSTSVSGLTAGVSYTFKVAAVNAAGTGPESLPSNAVTPTR